jgi:hypothetical protein
MALNGTAIRLTKSSALLTAAPFTFAAWVYLNNVTAAPGVFCIQNAGGTSYFQIWLGGTTYKANAEAGNAGTAGTAIATLTLVASTWYHMCAVFTSATSRTMYVNAANNATNTTSVTPTGLTTTLIASDYDGTTYYDMTGRIAVPAFWNVALTAAEITELYTHRASPLQVRPSALVGFAPLVGASPEQDLCSSTAWTVTGSPTFIANPGNFRPI